MEGIKKQAIKMIESMPDGVSLDDIMSELYFKIQIDKGLKELEEGKWVPHEKVEERFSKWLTK